MNHLARVLLLVGFVFGSVALQAQNGRLVAANKQSDNLSYLSAVRLYEDFLRTDKKKDPATTREAMIKLGYAYRKLQDMPNAERVYGELIKNNTDLDSEMYLYYAQALASNGKYREAQRQYSQYGEKQTADLRGRRFTSAYMDMNRFYRDSSQYRIFNMPFNSRQADFSPMYYKSGLVFVSSRDESGAIKRVFNWNQTPFLDMFFFPDTNQLRQPGNEQMVNTAILGSSTDHAEVAPAAGNQKISKAEKFSRTLNSKYHEGPMTFTKDQSMIVFTRNNGSKGKSGKSNDGIRKLKLYSSVNRNGKWVDIKELPFNNPDYSVGHPAFSPDNSKLYFVSDMPGGFGGTDVYVVEFAEGQWGTPVNMGKEINTEGNEMFPYADERGNLYFSSDGHEGLGGLDVFYAELRDGVAYKGVENIGAPVNSDKDDFGIITDASRTKGFFSSNRRKGVSDDDIYSFRRACKQLNIFVYDTKTGAPIETADVRVLREGISQELRVTNDEGRSEMCVDANTDYEFKAVKEGYAVNSVRFSTLTQSMKPVMSVSVYLNKSENTIIKGVVRTEVNQKPAAGVKVTLHSDKDQTDQTVTTGLDGGYEFSTKANSPVTLTARKNKYTTKKTKYGKTKGRAVVTDSLGLYGEGDVFQLSNIYYDLNKFFIRADAARELDKVVKLLQEYPAMKIEMASYTDSRSSDAYNAKLSQNRARAVVDYIVSRGIQPNRLSARGYGESDLVNGCADGVECSDTQHQQNRRTEFKITSVQ